MTEELPDSPGKRFVLLKTFGETGKRYTMIFCNVYETEVDERNGLLIACRLDTPFDGYFDGETREEILIDLGIRYPELPVFMMVHGTYGSLVYAMRDLWLNVVGFKDSGLWSTNYMV